MGGLAFSSGNTEALQTPRMPPVVYRAVRDQCVNKLKAVFNHVAVPVEGPDKKSHGDIDILVSDPNSAPSGPAADPLDAVIHMLNPVAHIKHGKDGNFAVPWPMHLLPAASSHDLVSKFETDSATILDILTAVDKSRGTDRQGAIFIQVDVCVSSSASNLRWQAFKHCHGDIWNILGAVIRAYGLTADGHGLTIRVAEMENRNRKKSKIFLTNNPSETLEFLGLDNYPPPGTAYKAEDEDDEYKFVTGRLAGQEIWPVPFPSTNAMFEYATSCRMFWLKPDPPPDSPKGSGNSGVDCVQDEDAVGPRDGTCSRSIESSDTLDRENLRSRERRRINYRPVFSRWMQEFLPSLREDVKARTLEIEASGGLGESKPGAAHTSLGLTHSLVPPYTRDHIRLAAFASFPGSQERYDAALAEFEMQEKLSSIKRDLKSWVPEEEWQTVQWRGECLAAFRRLLFEGNTSFTITAADADPEHPLRDARGVWVPENARRFVSTHWRAVGERAHQQPRHYSHTGLPAPAQVNNKNKKRKDEPERRAVSSAAASGREDCAANQDAAPSTANANANANATHTPRENERGAEPAQTPPHPPDLHPSRSASS